MNLTPIEEFRAGVMIDVPGCPVVAVDDALLKAAREFCQKTWIWEEDLDPALLAPGSIELEFDLPTGTNLCGFVYLYQGETGEIWPGTPYQVTPNNVVLFGQALNMNQSTLFRARVALKPTLSSTSLPQPLYTDYDMTICAGAKAFLMLQLTRPWANPALASENYRAFQEGTSQARIRKAYNRTSGTLTVKPNRWI